MESPSRDLPTRLLTLLPLLTLPACHTAYVLRSAAFQAELLAAREPIDRALGRGDLDVERARKLALVPRIKTFGERLGLTSTGSYQSVASRWERSLINLSACPPLSLEPRTWWFPIVGRVPYLGFFRESDARRWEERLTAAGFEVWTRPVGAYSTLGWFRDPVLPGMLDWQEHRLAEVVLHEMAHATLWVPGNASFNETYAMIVGEEASRLWMVAEHGPGSGQVHAMELDRHDAYLWQALLRRLHDDLDALYRSADLSPEERLSRKAARFAALDEDVACAGFFFTERFLRMAREERWNNARVAQARTYDSNRALLDALLTRHGGDLMSFTEELTFIAERPDGLWDAVRTAAGSPAPDPKADLPSSATGALPID